MTLDYNKKYINDTEVKIKCDDNSRKKPCEYSPAVRFNLLQDLARPYLQFSQIDLTTNKTEIEQILILCLFDSSGIDVFMKMIFDQIRKNISFNIICPIKKQIMQFYSYKQNYGVWLNFIPLNTPHRHHAILKNRFTKKKIETFLTYSVDFEIVENWENFFVAHFLLRTCEDVELNKIFIWIFFFQRFSLKLFMQWLLVLSWIFLQNTNFNIL